MNANAKAWVKDLRTTKDKQGFKTLKDADGNTCSLGRACELAIKAGVIKSYEPTDFRVPHAVRQWLGLVDSKGSCLNASSIAYLNDCQKLSFAEIADWIESEPAGLFMKDGE